MSAATKAKIASSMKGNKNAYKNGPKVKTKQNKGYTKRRKLANAALLAGGVGAVGLLGASPLGIGLAIGAGARAARSHIKGQELRSAKKSGRILLRTNRKGQVKKQYVAGSPKVTKKKVPKGKKVKR